MPTATLQARDYNSGGGDLTGKGRRIELYLVDARSTVVNVHTIPHTIIGLPQKGQPHAQYPQLLCDSLSVEPAPENPNEYSFVVAGFSNDRSFRYNPRPDRSEAFFKSWEGAVETVEIVIPQVLTTPMTAPENPTVVAYDHEILKPIVEEQRGTYTRQVVFQAFNATNINIIKRETNALHLIDGKLLLFKGAGAITQTEPNAWETYYTWEDDDGTATTSISVHTQQFNPYGTASVPITGTNQTLHVPPAVRNALTALIPGYSEPGTKFYSRPPFATLEVVLSSKVPTPTFIATVRKKINTGSSFGIGLGWNDLPGDPI